MLSLGLYKRKMGQKGNTITQDFHLEIETSFFPQNNKEINGWSLLNGIRKINNLRLLFLIVFFLGINQFSIAQEDWKEVKVEQIISVNRFVIKEISTEKEYEIQISKTKPISQSDSLYKEGIAFLKENVLGKNLFFIFSNRKDNILEGSILYGC